MCLEIGKTAICPLTFLTVHCHETKVIHVESRETGVVYKHQGRSKGPESANGTTSKANGFKDSRKGNIRMSINEKDNF